MASATSSAATLPPETTATTGPGAGATRPASSAASAAAAAGSATTFARSASRRIAATDLVVGDQHDVVHQIADELVGERAGERRREAVGDRRDPLERHGLARCERARERRSTLGLDPDDAHAGAQVAQRDRGAADQPAAADRDDDRADVRDVVDDLEPERPLAGEHERVVERVDQDHAALVAHPEHLLEGLERRVAQPQRLGAVGLRGVELQLRGGLPGHHHGRGAGERRGVGDGLRVVARRDGDHAARVLVRRQRRDAVVRAARLERAGDLEELELEPQVVDAGRLAERARRLDGRVPDRRRSEQRARCEQIVVRGWHGHVSSTFGEVRRGRSRRPSRRSATPLRARAGSPRRHPRRATIVSGRPLRSPPSSNASGVPSSTSQSAPSARASSATRRAAGASASATSGTRKSAPIEARTAFGASGSAVPSPSTTCAGPSTSAERTSVPTLPGSATPCRRRPTSLAALPGSEPGQRGLLHHDRDARVVGERRGPGEHLGRHDQHLAADGLERALERRDAALVIDERAPRARCRRRAPPRRDPRPRRRSVRPPRARSRHGVRGARAAPGGADCGACPRSFEIRPLRPTRRARPLPASRSPRRRRARARRCPRAPCGRA